MLRQASNCAHWRKGPAERPRNASCAACGGGAISDVRCASCPQHTRLKSLRGKIDASPEPVVTRFGGDAGIQNLYLGGQVFLVLCGPSLRELDLSLLSRRGIVTMGVNNVAAQVRTTLWTFGDNVVKFHDAIFRDAGIIKFVPVPRLGTPIRTRADDGRLVHTTLAPQDFAGVFGLRRNNTFDPKTWLWEDTVNWGNGKKEAAKNGYPHVNNTMVQALRLCHYLGFRTVYLLGCDFTMAASYRYAFPERRSQGAVDGNNRSYGGLTTLFELLRPEFDAAGYTVVNCNPNSNLTVFDYLPYEAAVEAACYGIEQEPDTVGWYED